VQESTKKINKKKYKNIQSSEKSKIKKTY